MSGHLPECPGPAPCDRWDICDRLRACEQRSYALGMEVGKHDGWIAGHAAGLAAARDAVAALPQHWPNSPALHRGTALAAIDAVRGDA